MLSNHLILSPSSPLPSAFPSIRVFSNESAFLIRWPKYCSFSFSISPSSEHTGLISFKIDWFYLLAVQGTLKSSPEPQFESINSWHSIFFMVQLLHPYMTTGKAIALTIWTFVSKVISPLSNMLFVIAFLPRNKCLLISWLQSLFTVILEPKGKKNMPLFPVFEYVTEIQIFLSHCQYIRNCFSPFN